MLERGRRRLPTWTPAAAVLGLVAVALVALGLFTGSALPERTGPPVEELTVERTVLSASTIDVTVRNTGPDPVTVAQVSVNDAFADVRGGEAPIPPLGSTTLAIDYPWQEGNPYAITLLTDTGVTIDHEIPAATTTPPFDVASIGRMALLGVYIGIVPVLLGIAFLPALRRAGTTVRRAVLALTVGLLGFLAVDATLEGVDLGAQTGGAFGGVALLGLGAVLAFFALSALSGLGRGSGDAATGPRLAVLIAVGIGLHNLSEGLAVGSAYAVGELALGAALVVGFAAHNLTEGIAIVSPLTDQKVSLARLGGLGLIAGAPAALGVVLGSTATTAAMATLLLGVGVGAIAQVVAQLWPLLRPAGARRLDLATLGGLGVGVLAMYLTGLLVLA